MPISEMQDRLPYRQLTPPSDLDHYFPPSQYVQEQIRNNENAQPIEAVSNPNIVVNPEVAESQPEATGTSTENRTGLGAL
jgi:hypothetical protein